MAMLSCYLKRRSLGPYLDNALPERDARTLALHLDTCATCRSEADSLTRLRAMVRRTAAVAEPDWSGFWPGVVRGIEAARHAPGPRAPERIAWLPRLALAGTMVAALLAVSIWQAAETPIGAERGVIVHTVHTDYPGGSVMVYSPAGDEMTVIWVFGGDRPGGGA